MARRAPRASDWNGSGVVHVEQGWSAMSLRVMTYNVRYFGHRLKGLASTRASKRDIATALAGLEVLPDVIALQEVETRSIRSRATRVGGEDETQLDVFMRQLGHALEEKGRAQSYQALYFPAHCYRLGRVTFYTTGLSVLVNRATLETITHNGAEPHPITHHRNERLRRVKQTRIAAHVTLGTKAGRRWHLINTHLSLPTAWAPEFWSQGPKMGFGLNQLAEAKAVHQFAEQRAEGEPFVVLGDFNAAPASPVYEFFTREAKLVGAQESLGLIDASRPDSFATAGFMAMRMHLDHVFGQGVTFTDMEGTFAFGDERSPFDGLSDHAPLFTRLDW
jgi:endonuclease/exonuclease/phosphatase family metal-dependent hydrolase